MSGGGSFGKSKNESENQMAQQFAQNVWGPSGQAQQNLYGQTGGMFDAAAMGAPEQMQFGQQFGQNLMEQSVPAWQQQLGGGATGGMDLQQQLSRSLAQSSGQPSAMSRINAQVMGGEGNTYADAMKNQYIQDANRASENMLSNLDARATAAGMSGGARQGVAQAGGFRDINQNLQRNLAETGYGTFERDLDRKLGIAQQADQSTAQRQQLMANMLGGQDVAQQGAMGGGQMFGQSQQQQLMPWQQAGMYAQALGGPTVLGSGTGTGSGSASGKGIGMSGSGGVGPSGG